MTTVLIADSCKPSLVMTSEVFKDKILGTVVDVAQTGKQALDYLTTKHPDLCVVDFDLPDVDGPALVEAMRRVYNGPILMTAFPSDIVKQAVVDNLFAYQDASAWIPKPINFDDLSEKIDRFLVSKHRLERRFMTSFATQLIGKAAGRGKRAPKVEGKVLNISLGGACIKIQGPVKVKKSQELTMSIEIPDQETETKSPRKQKSLSTVEAKLKAKVAWINGKGEVGLQFGKMSDSQKRQLELYFKNRLTINI
ncbi:MAG: response regulator [Proteobacteria bacterium]|nr:response regulator [Pseudomonadota bacterium]